MTKGQIQNDLVSTSNDIKTFVLSPVKSLLQEIKLAPISYKYI